MNFRAVEYYETQAKKISGNRGRVTSRKTLRRNCRRRTTRIFRRSLHIRSPAMCRTACERAHRSCDRRLFRSITLGSQLCTSGVLQDILRLLTLWFAHGAKAEVNAALQKGFEMVSIGTWLHVIPQLIARVRCPEEVKTLSFTSSSAWVGNTHRHWCITLTVASKSSTLGRQQAMKITCVS